MTARPIGSTLFDSGIFQDRSRAMKAADVMVTNVITVDSLIIRPAQSGY
jgi:hypothetical protein